MQMATQFFVTNPQLNNASRFNDTSQQYRLIDNMLVVPNRRPCADFGSESHIVSGSA